MNDLRVEVRFKNQRLFEECWRRRSDDPRSTGTPELARRAGISYGTLLGYLNCEISPKRILRCRDGKKNWRNGEIAWRISAQKLAEFLGALPEEIFPEALYPQVEQARRHKFAFVVDSARLLPLAAARGLLAKPGLDERLDRDSLRSAVTALLSTLRPRDRQVVALRFGLDGEREHGLEQAAKVLGVSRERVRQIESRALRALREPRRSRHLKTFLDPLGV